MPLEILKTCPVCNASNFANLITAEDYTVSNKEFTIQECTECHFLFTNPRPDSLSIGDYYQSKDYISHHDEANSLISKVYNMVRNITIAGKIKMIDSIQPSKGTILDIGCGTGTFIMACKKDGWKINATEPDTEARNIASNRVGATIYDNINNDDISSKTFDIITLWHVLEHVHLLNETIQWIKEHLNPGGKIIIAVPNPQSFDAKKYGRFWAAFDVPRHLYHFTSDTMKLLLDRHGLALQDIKPMWFDSFYVSMLSTKYKYKSSNFPDSIATGLLSNIKGISSKNQQVNTSSLIYIITKE